MFRGMTKFTCDDCGNKFMGMDRLKNLSIEKCGSK